MSAFLGPIHYWLYHKIQIQEAWIHSILEAASAKGWHSVSPEKLDAAWGKLELPPLEEVIDGSNIHGWLHERIGLTEIRLAFLLTTLLNEDTSRLANLKQTAYQFGKKHTVREEIGADEAFKILEDTLLDGMPCDHVNHIAQRSPDKVIWRKTQCVRTEYWERVNGDVTVYDTLRAELIAGMLAHCSLELSILGNNEYEISRKGR